MLTRMKTVYAFVVSQGRLISMGDIQALLDEYSHAEVREAVSGLCGGGLLTMVRDGGHIFYRKATPNEIITRIYANARAYGMDGFND